MQNDSELSHLRQNSILAWLGIEKAFMVSHLWIKYMENLMDEGGNIYLYSAPDKVLLQWVLHPLL